MTLALPKIEPYEKLGSKATGGESGRPYVSLPHPTKQAFFGGDRPRLSAQGKCPGERSSTGPLNTTFVAADRSSHLATSGNGICIQGVRRLS